MKDLLLKFKHELEQYLEQGKSLQEISQITFNRREAGENIPYMGIEQKIGNMITRIGASPTKKQKELRAFFDELAEGSRITKYSLYIDLEESNKVVFKEKLGKGKDNFILL